MSEEKEGGKEPKNKFEELYRRYRNMMYWTAYGLLKDTYEAESMVQDAFVLLSGKMDRIEEVESAKTCAYLKVIVEHLSINYLKKKKKILLLEEVRREYVWDEKKIRDSGMRRERCGKHWKNFLILIIRFLFCSIIWSIAEKRLRKF